MHDPAMVMLMTIVRVIMGVTRMLTRVACMTRFTGLTGVLMTAMGVLLDHFASLLSTVCTTALVASQVFAECNVPGSASNPGHARNAQGRDPGPPPGSAHPGPGRGRALPEDNRPCRPVTCER